MNVDLTAYQSPKGWLCPSCGKAHGPHVDTCPETTIAGMKPPFPVGRVVESSEPPIEVKNYDPRVGSILRGFPPGTPPRS